MTPKIFDDNIVEVIATSRGHMAGAPLRAPRTRSSKGAQESAAGDSGASKGAEAEPADDGEESDEEGESTYLVDHSFRTCSDQTGGITNAALLKFIMVVVHEDTGYIKLIPLTSKTAGVLVKAYQTAYDFFRRQGFSVLKERLDNECSIAFKEFLRTRDPPVKLELVQAHKHRANPAERAIRTAKEHLISALAGVDPGCPKEAYKHFLPQIEIQVNILRPSKHDAGCSAYFAMHGRNYDFIQKPMAPLGTRCEVYSYPSSKERTATLAEHSEPAWYVGPAPDSSRSFTVFTDTTYAIRVSDAVAFFPTAAITPRFTAVDILAAVAADVKAVSESFALTQATTAGPRARTEQETPSMLIGANGVPAQSEQESPPSTTSGGTTESREQATPRGTANSDASAAPEQATPRSSVSSGPPSTVAEESTPHRPVSTAVISAPAQTEQAPPSSSATSGPPGEHAEESTLQHPGGSTTSALRPAVATVSKLAELMQLYDLYPNAPLQQQHMEALREAATAATGALQQAASKIEAEDSDVTAAIDLRAATKSAIDSFAQIGSALLTRTATGRALAATATASPLQTDYTVGSRSFVDNAPKTYRQAVQGPDAAAWIQANTDNFVKEFETGSMRIVDECRGPPAFYKLALKVKEDLDKKKIYVIKGTYGNNVDHTPGYTHNYAAGMDLFKFLCYVLVNEGTQAVTADISHFYLNSKLPEPAWMRIKFDQLTEEIIARYNLERYRSQGHINVEVINCIYGHPLSGRIAFVDLVAHLHAAGYSHCPTYPALFRSLTGQLLFCVATDDFFIVPKRGFQHEVDKLLQVLRQHYDIKTDDKGANYLGFNIAHSKKRGEVKLSMPGANQQIQERFAEHLQGVAAKSTPAAPVDIVYGQSVQYEPVDTSPPLDAARKQLLMEIVGCKMYVARAVQYDVLTATCKLASEQAHATDATWKKALHLLSYDKDHLEPHLTFKAESMMLHGYCDASYLSEAGSRSRGGDFSYIGHPYPAPPNAAIEPHSQVLKCVLTSAAQAEHAELFEFAQDIVAQRQLLEWAGYIQDFPTPIYEDNQATYAIVHKAIKQRKSKSWAMRDHATQEMQAQRVIDVTKIPGADQLADYFTKNNPPALHAARTPLFVTYPAKPSIH
jgi:hypothetical protein